MAVWEREDHGQWTCPKCGNVYAITCMRYPSKDRVEISCECGELIFRGNTTRDYDNAFIRKGDPGDSRNNHRFD